MSFKNLVASLATFAILAKETGMDQVVPFSCPDGRHIEVVGDFSYDRFIRLEVSKKEKLGDFSPYTSFERMTYEVEKIEIVFSRSHCLVHYTKTEFGVMFEIEI